MTTRMNDDDELAALELLVDAWGAHVEKTNAAIGRMNAVAEALVSAARHYGEDDDALLAAIGEIENA